MKTFVSENWTYKSEKNPQVEELVNVLQSIDKHTFIDAYDPRAFKIMIVTKRIRDNFLCFPLTVSGAGYDLATITYTLNRVPQEEYSKQDFRDAGFDDDDLLELENRSWFLVYDPENETHDYEYRKDKATLLAPSKRFEDTFFKRIGLPKLYGDPTNFWRFGLAATMMEEYGSEIVKKAEDYKIVYRVADNNDVGKCFAVMSSDFVMPVTDTELFQLVWDGLSRTHDLALHSFCGNQTFFSIFIELKDIHFAIDGYPLVAGAKLAFSDIGDGKYELAPCLFYKDAIMLVGGKDASYRSGHIASFNTRTMVTSFNRKGIKAIHSAMEQVLYSAMEEVEDAEAVALKLLNCSEVSKKLGSKRCKELLENCEIEHIDNEHPQLFDVYTYIFEVLNEFYQTIDINFSNDSFVEPDKDGSVKTTASVNTQRDVCKASSNLFEEYILEKAKEIMLPNKKTAKKGGR